MPAEQHEPPPTPDGLTLSGDACEPVTSTGVRPQSYTGFKEAYVQVYMSAPRKDQIASRARRLNVSASFFVNHALDLFLRVLDGELELISTGTNAEATLPPRQSEP